jgi:hypothetical protein
MILALDMPMEKIAKQREIRRLKILLRNNVTSHCDKVGSFNLAAGKQKEKRPDTTPASQ